MSSEPATRSIAVLRALPGVGDMLCLVPALRAVRAAEPRSHVVLVGLPSARWLVARYPELCDEVVVAEGVAGIPEVVPDPPAALRFLASAQARRFDLALGLHGSGVTTNPLVTLLGARTQVTARLPGHWIPPGTSVAYPSWLPEVHRLLAVVEAAGFPPKGDRVHLPVRPADQRSLDAVAAAAGLPDGPIACVHPGATRPANRWPVERFAAAADHLAGRGYRVVLTGTADERGLARAVARAMRAPAVDLSGRTGIGTLAALLGRASIALSNDTGAAHVAAATGTPSVVLFAPDGDPDRWAPLDRDLHLRLRGGRAGGWPTLADVVRALDTQLARWAGGGTGARTVTSRRPEEHV
ncbi:MAG: glycosyltransferase family 9 protein [Acidimicrobiia bacterium]